MNSYWIAHALSQKITEVAQSLKICNSFNTNRVRFKIAC